MDSFHHLFFSLLCLIFLFTRSMAADDNSTQTSGDAIISNIGAIVDTSSRIGKEEIIAMGLALEDFCHCNNRSLTLHIKDSQGKPIAAALAAQDLINTHQVRAILGPQTWEEVSLVAEIGSENQVPVLSFADTIPKWAIERRHFLIQASPNKHAQMKAIAAIVQSWNWHQVSVIYEDVDSSASGVIPHLYDALREVGAEINQVVALPPFASSSITTELEGLKRGQCRVFIVHTSLRLAMHLFEMAKNNKMMERDYVWITTDPITSLVHSINTSVLSSMQGIVGIRSYFPETGKDFQDFHGRFRKMFSTQFPEEDNNDPGIFAVQAYDSVRAIVQAIQEGYPEGKQLLEKILLSEFNGLSGKFQFFSGSRTPASTFQIGNVMRSYWELGFWTHGSGFSETIDESAKHTSSMKDLGQVFWPGGRSHDAPRGWTVPTSANPLRIVVPGNSGYKEFVEVHELDGSGNIRVSGFAIDVFNAILDVLPFFLPYKFYSINGSNDVLVQQIHQKKFDAVVGDVAIVARRFNYSEFTNPYTDTGLVLVVPTRTKTSNRAWLFMKPFTGLMWILIAVINLYNGFVVWLIERNDCPELRGSIFNQIGVLIWIAFTTLFSLTGERMHSNLSRISMVVWLFVALVITQTYTANLASMLTVQRLEPTVADVETLINTNAPVGYCSRSFLESYLVEVLKFKRENLKNYTALDAYAEAFEKKEIAGAFLEEPVAKLFLAKYCKGFMRTGQAFKIGGFGFAFPLGSPLLPSINKALLSISERGKLLELENKFLALHRCPDKDSDDDMEELEEETSLSPNSFCGLFIITGGTSTVALLIYILRVGNNSMLNHHSIWRLMLAIMKNWRHHSRRLNRRVSSAETPPNSSPTRHPFYV